MHNFNQMKRKAAASNSATQYRNFASRRKRLVGPDASIHDALHPRIDIAGDMSI